MKTKMIWANLAVKNLKITADFYTKLGFIANGKNDSDQLTSFKFADNNFIIHFFVEKNFSEAISLDPEKLTTGNEIIFSLMADSKEHVKQWLETVQSAGGKIFSEPTDFQKGYTFGFSDPDGHKFNVLYWPEN